MRVRFSVSQHGDLRPLLSLSTCISFSLSLSTSLSLSLASSPLPCCDDKLRRRPLSRALSAGGLNGSDMIEQSGMEGDMSEDRASKASEVEQSNRQHAMHLFSLHGEVGLRESEGSGRRSQRLGQMNCSSANTSHVECALLWSGDRGYRLSLGIEYSIYSSSLPPRCG